MRTDLTQAYLGFYEEDASVRAEYEVFVREELARQKRLTGGEFPDSVLSFESWLMLWINRKIVADSPMERLRVYLHWNGIHGYDGAIFAIATGST